MKGQINVDVHEKYLKGRENVFSVYLSLQKVSQSPSDPLSTIYHQGTRERE